MQDQQQSETTERADPITLVVTNVVRPEHDEEFRQGAARVAEQVRASEPGTLLYALTKLPGQTLAGIDVGDVFGHTYVWVERFEDEAALKQHMSMPYVGEFLAAARSWLVGPPQLLQLAQVACA